MIQIDDAIISYDVVEKEFVCNLAACKGLCCVHGDAGAPLEEEEKALLRKQYKKVKPFLTAEGKAAIRKNGLFYRDDDGDWVTTLIEGKQCAFSIQEKGVYSCGIEKAYESDESMDFRKPLSCHLYPVRISRYKDFEAVNYDKWEICNPACQLGSSLKVPVYKFVSEALIRKYGSEWYEKLEWAATHLQVETKQDG